MNFISCAKWIKKGVAKSNPEKVQLTPEELQRIINTTRDDIKDLEGGETEDEPMEEVASSSTGDGYKFDEYDKEDEVADSLFGIGNLVADVDDDYKIRDEDYDSEEEDDKIKPTDNLIAVGHVEGDASVLEIFLYNEQDGDLYVHHDILLPTVPLCLEWLSYEPTDPKPGNLIAVGGMSAVIGVWDLDVIDCLEPAYQLGKFSVKRKRNKSHGHKDAVLDISWNKNYKHILASGSVDKTVILWDLDVGRAGTTFTEFDEKIQSLKWHPVDYHFLLVGSADKTVKLFDCRLTEISSKWEFNEEIEKVAWCPWDNNKVYFGTNSGNVLSYDIRQPKKQLWEVQAHLKEITGLELDDNCPEMLVTSSMDEMVKVWDIQEDSPKLKCCKSFGVGEIQCVDLNPDCPYVACIGGTKKKKNFKVVNLQHEMLQNTSDDIVNQEPVIFNEGSSSSSKSTNNLQLTENAFKSLTLKNKPFKSKKKFGHKHKQT
ncbi:periodic tryptophan protein 1 homolog [Lycorma delicatula]|uniref:periodic tryptophan protein 1 homolog n=1 Tax=Lycorma delicatula TaxID=130591 RepID=UPI003F516A52